MIKKLLFLNMALLSSISALTWEVDINGQHLSADANVKDSISVKLTDYNFEGAVKVLEGSSVSVDLSLSDKDGNLIMKPEMIGKLGEEMALSVSGDSGDILAVKLTISE
jgi:hypothetical protein